MEQRCFPLISSGADKGNATFETHKAANWKGLWDDQGNQREYNKKSSCLRFAHVFSICDHFSSSTNYTLALLYATLFSTQAVLHTACTRRNVRKRCRCWGIWGENTRWSMRKQWNKWAALSLMESETNAVLSLHLSSFLAELCSHFGRNNTINLEWKWLQLHWASSEQ